MTRARRALLVAAAAGGEALALAGAWAIVVLRYRWDDPAAAAASAGMYAFGDSVLVLAGFGVLSLAPTWLLFRALRDLDGFWRALSWAGLGWAALAPIAATLWLLASLGAGPGASTAPPRVAAEGLSLLRLLATSTSLPALALAWWACRHPPSTRRLGLAIALEAAGLLGFFAWSGWSLLRAR